MSHELPWRTPSEGAWSSNSNVIAPRTVVSVHYALILSVVTLASACTEEIGRDQQPFDQQFKYADEAMDEFEVDLERDLQGQPPTGEETIREVRPGYPQDELPPEMLVPDSVFLVSNKKMKLGEILGRISRISGIPCVYRPAAVRAAAQSSAGPGVANAEPALQSVRLEGSLAEVLDLLASLFDVSWSYGNNRVEFSDRIVVSYRIHAMPKETSNSVTVGGSSSSATLNLTDEIERTISSLAGAGSEVSFGKSTGTVVVHARPSIHRKIKRYIRQLNQFLGQQIAFDVNVITVTSTRTAARGAGLDLFSDDGLGNSIKWLGNQAITPSASSINVGIAVGHVSLDAILSQLRKIGRVAVETRTGATTSNNRIVPIQVIRDTAYAKRVEATPDSQGVIRTSISADTLTTGFEMHLFPRMLNSHEVQVDYSIKLSELNELAEFTSDRQTIQLPRVSTTLFEQQAILQSGDTLVLAGFERERRAVDSQENTFFGRKRTTSKERISTVVTVRPRFLRKANLRESWHDDERG